MKPIILLTAGLMIYILAACSTDVDFGEQYKKIIYIVNSNNRVITQKVDIAPENKGAVTVYCGGTEFSGNDITVQYKMDTAAMNAYNKNEHGNITSKYMIAVPAEAVSFGQPDITIRAGEEYGVLNFTVNTTNLDPFVTNAIPVTITQTSEGEINPKLQTLFYALQIVIPPVTYNCEVGTYTWLSVFKSKETVQKTTQKIARNTIRVPILNNTEITDGKNNSFDVVWNEEDNTVTLTNTPPNFTQRKIFRPNNVLTPVNYYNPETKEFVLCYIYPDNVAGPEQIITYEIIRLE